MKVQWLLLLIGMMVFLSHSKETEVEGLDFRSTNGGLYYNNQRFRLKGLSWFGFETSLAVFHGLWSVDYNFLFDFVAKNGFNAMRIPFCLDMVLNDPMPKSISFGYCSNNVSCNLDLKGLTSLQVLDKMIKAAAARGIAVMLDMHSFEPDAFQSNGLWYDATHPESVVLQGWDKLINLFGKSPNVIAVDLKNEPFLGTWNTGNPATDWNAAAQRIGNHIHSKGANWLIFVEGVASSPPCADACFYGGNLQGVQTAPITLTVPQKLVYSPHTYGPDVYPQKYFSDPTFPNNMPAIWDKHFGFIRNQSNAAVVTGEWGGFLRDKNQIWLNAFVKYLLAKDMTDNFFWCLNPDSGDTGGLLDNDWITPIPGKLELLQTLVPNPTKVTYV